MVKVCSRCGSSKAHSEFVRSTVTSNGVGAHCLLCERERVRVRRSNPEVRHKEQKRGLVYRVANAVFLRSRGRERTSVYQAWLNAHKDKPCADCGRSFHPCAMDFDHVRGEKFRGVGEMLSYSREHLLVELAKCDLICANCHRIRTEARRGAVHHPPRQRYYAKIDALKDGSCCDCGGRFPPDAMDFDHVRGIKVASIAQMRSRAWEHVLIELAKCELVCANCHRIRTWQRKQATKRAA